MIFIIRNNNETSIRYIKSKIKHIKKNIIIMLLFGKRFYAPIYVGALLLLGMFLIYLSELTGLSKREENLELRNANSIEIAYNSIKLKIKKENNIVSHDNCINSVNNMMNYNDDALIYDNSNILVNEALMNLKNDDNNSKINKINNILLSSIS